MSDVMIFDMALAVARGERSLNFHDIQALAERLEVYNLNPESIPGRATISGKPSERKTEIFRLAQNFWGITPEGWLAMESSWLQSARLRSGSKEKGGKDSLDDVISAELLIRTIASVRFIATASDLDSVLVRDALLSLNLVVDEAVTKGRTRLNRHDGHSHYTALKNAGIMIGTGGGKYLPAPERSLPMLFLLLNRKVINPQAYL